MSTTNPDTIAHVLLGTADELEAKRYPDLLGREHRSEDDAELAELLRQAAALISDQAETIGVLQARLSEGEALLAQSIEIYDRRDAALKQIAAFPIESHTCRDHVMRDIARKALEAQS